MNPKLHSLLLEIDNRDWTSDKYFEWSEEQKNKLTEDITLFFIPLLKMGKHQAYQVMYGLETCVENALIEEDYEQAEILTRCFRSINNIASHINYYD